MDAKHKGARNELVAICWLMSLGYEVFRNVSQHGAADVIATRGEEILLLDIRASLKGYVPFVKTAEQKARGVKLVLVSPEGTCSIADFAIPIERNCAMCGKLITTKRATRYCSPFCKRRAAKDRLLG